LKELLKEFNSVKSRVVNLNPLTGFKTLALARRGKRPLVKEKKECFFCPGRERFTPPTTFALPSEANWHVRCFKNAFPISENHEVIVETREHDELFQNLGDEQLAMIFEAYKNRFQDFEKRGCDCVFLFRNHGVASGASVPHEHAQIIGFNFTPELIAREVDSFSRVFRETGESILHSIIVRERLHVFAREKEFVAFTPSFARFPFECWIAPKRHARSILDFSGGSALAFMRLLREVTRRVARVSPDYTVAFHSAPRGVRDFHFHVEVYPRFVVWGGIELGAGVFVNPKPARDAVKELKKKKI